MISERAQGFIARAEAAASMAEFEAVYRDAAAADASEAFTEEDKHALAGAFNDAAARLARSDG